LIHPAYCVIRS